MSSRANFTIAGEAPQHYGLESSLTYVWDVGTLSWVKSTGGGGGGGGAVTVADGADVAQGTTTDVAWVAGAGTVISLLKKIASAGGSAVSIADGSDVAEGSKADAAWVSGSGSVISILKTIAAGGAGLTDAQLRATPVPVSGTVTASGPLTDAQLRASAVPVSGPLTDTQLRATPVPVSGTVTASGPLTDAQLRASAVPVSGPLTDAQLRAVAVPVSGTVTTGGLTDAQLRATPIDVTGSFSASTAADVLAVEGDAGYVVGDLAKNLTQTDDGRLRVVSSGLISDVPNPYLDGDVRSLSMTNDGRLRVSTVPARYSVPFFSEEEENMWGEQNVEYSHTGSPWADW